MMYIDLKSLSNKEGFSILGAISGDQIGYSVSSAGDFNADGINDIIIGAPHSSRLSRNQSGNSYVIYGKAGGYSKYIDISDLTSSIGFAIVGAISGDQIGYSVSSAGDFNADGINDIIIGAPHSSSLSRNQSGNSYVIYGKAGGYLRYIDISDLTLDIGVPIVGANSGDQIGYSVSSAGDFNADGISDIVIGAPHSSSLSRNQSGSTYVVYGKVGRYSRYIDVSYLPSNRGLAIVGANSGDQIGYSVSSAGDFNADGIKDILIGAPFKSPLGRINAGSIYVVYGKKNGYSSYIDLSTISTTQGFEIAGAAAGDFTGISVDSAGDINADGIDDIIIGASSRSPLGRTQAGSAYVVYGKKGGYSSYIDLAKILVTQGFEMAGTSAEDHTGISVSGAGDMNADGVDDILIGAFARSSLGRTQAGSAYVVYGKKGGYSSYVDLAKISNGGATNGLEIVGANSGDNTGTSISGVGDVNSDGIDDILIGAFDASPLMRSQAGISYIVYGGQTANDLSGYNNTSLESDGL